MQRKNLWTGVLIIYLLMFVSSVWAQVQEDIKIPKECFGLSQKKNKNLYKECQQIIHPWVKNKVKIFNEALKKNNWKKLEEMVMPKLEQGMGIFICDIGGKDRSQEIKSLLMDNRLIDFKDLINDYLNWNPTASEILFDKKIKKGNFSLTVFTKSAEYVIMINGEYKGKFYRVRFCFPYAEDD